MKSTQAMRDRIRELSSAERDDYDRAVICVVDDLEVALSAKTDRDVQPAIDNLTNHQEQCDMDGVMVKVSRQALYELLAFVKSPEQEGPKP